MPPDRPTASRLRQELIDAKSRLAAGRESIRKQHDLGMAGFEVSRKLTALADEAIVAISESALADMPKVVADRLREKSVLVAHGGYGRRQMAPYSDVDVMLLHEGRVNKDVERYARRVTQDVFDIGLQLGQSLRTVEEAIRLARHDAVIATSLLESRLLTGSQPVMEEFRTQFLRMIQRRRSAACASFIAARKEERNKYGDTVYLLEPNVKRSPGALRDLHLLRWLWFANAGESDLDRLLLRGVLSKFDHRRLVNAREFLMRVRNDLHFHAGKQRDELSRAEQLRIAERFGYYQASGLLPVEQFMRDYFRHAGHIGFLATRISQLSSPKPTVDRVLGAVFGRRIEQDYQLNAREITATQQGRAKLERRLEEAWRVLDLARLSDRRITQDTGYLVYRSAPNYDTQATPALRERFLDILDNPFQLGALLRQAHEFGVLEKVLPDFARARCLLQFNQYHKYTVDEHSIRAVEEATRFADAGGQLAAVYKRFTPKWLLHLALLIHDLGKGREEDHSLVGERIAGQTAERLGLSAGDRDDLMFLVREHLNMNRTALRRDISDQATLESFAQLVGSSRRLTLLYLLTCADLAAVGPGVLNAWKADMIGALYSRVMSVLQPRRLMRAELRRSANRNATWQALDKSEREESWFKQTYQAFPEPFLADHPPAKVAATLQKLRGLGPREGVAWGDFRSDLGAVELLAGVDQGSGRGVFSSMAGALSAAGMQIIQAETSMLTQNLLLLRYVAQDTRLPGGPPEERIADLAQSMVASIDSNEPPKFRRVWGEDRAQSQAALANQPSEVRLDVDLTNEYLIVEVFTIDRLGLLYELARALHELELNISFAKIGTSGDRVVDVFYVQERNGDKPSSEQRLRQIRQRLEATISTEDA